MPASSLRPKGKRSVPAGGEPPRDWKSYFKKTIVLVLVISLAVHLLFLLAFGSVAIFKGSIPKLPFVSQEIAPEAVTEITPPPSEEEMAPVEETTTDPFAQEMPESSPAEESAPALEMLTVVGGANWAPAIPKNTPVSETGVIGGSGTGKGLGGGKGPGTGKKSSFFGIKIEQEAPRIILLLDTSNSMFERRRGSEMHTFDYSVIKKEAVELVKSLDETARFNVVLYEGGAVAFQNNMMALTEGFKNQASKWIQDIDEDPGTSIRGRRGEANLVEGNGTRLDTGFKLAFRYDPTTIFILTDGEANMRDPSGEFKKMTEDDILPLVKELQGKQKSPAVIHVIHYLTAQARASETNFLKAIAAQGRGKLKVVEAKTLKTEPLPEEKGKKKDENKNKKK